MIHKIIMFEGDIETTAYFSHQMEKTFVKKGFEVFFFNYEKQSTDIGRLLRFIERGKTAMISFNFHGLCGASELFFDEETSRYLWEDLDIPCFNIVVDHPFYYHRFMSMVPTNYTQISIDRYHQKYLHRFCKEIKCGPFMPLAGTSLSEDGKYKRCNERSMDVVFVGNYILPEDFDVYINRNGEEYAKFYRGILDELMQHTNKTLEEVAIRHIAKEIPEATEEDMKETLGHMIFLDMYIRFYYRALAIQTLVDAGITVHVFGSGWEKLECKRKECLIEGGTLDSKGCLEKLADAKISLNVMPWFKDGAHDRIFNSMLNGAVCLTDSSKYLMEELQDGKDVCFYELSNIHKLPEIVGELLEDKRRMEELAANGYKCAKQNHTWEINALEMIKLL